MHENHLCWIVHPGIVGDRGAHSLDYALLEFEDGKPESKMWGVTVLEASEEYDAGAIWSTEEFPLHASTKSELYHTSVARAAINAIDKALECYLQGHLEFTYISHKLTYFRCFCLCYIHCNSQTNVCVFTPLLK